MKIKMTVTLPDEIIKKIKLYAKENGVSVSKVVSLWIDIVTTPKVKSKEKIKLHTK